MYEINKFGIFREDTKECIHAAIPIGRNENVVYIEAEDDDTAKLIYECGDYSE